MAVIPPLLTRQSVLAMKAETTTGTAEALTAAEAAYNAMDVKITPSFTNTPRMGQSSLSRLPSTPGPASGRITFSQELYGSGVDASTPPPWAETWLKASGFAGTSGVYKPVTGSASYTTLTAALYTDGIKEFLAGCAFNWTLRGEYDKPCVFEVEGLGVWQAPADAAILAPTYPTVIPPKLAGVTFTIGGTSYRLSDFELAMNNTLYLREDATRAPAYLAACVPDRDVRFKVTVESTLLATKDWYAMHAAGTEVAISLAIGSVAGNNCTIALPKAQLSATPQKAAAGGTVKHTLEFQCNRNAAAGDDEVALTFA